MSNQRKARVGFIGAGNFISSYHLPTAAASSIMEVRAIADLDEEKLASHRSQYDIGYTTTDYRKILVDDSIDIVIVGTKQELHARMTIEALQAGKWVWCEKPMAETPEQSAAVLEAEATSPGKLAIGLNRRFAPACRQAKQLMQRIKRPWFINYRLMYPAPHKKGTYYYDLPHILYEGCHVLDLVCWLVDDQPRRVFMSGGARRNNCSILDFSDGSQVSFMCGTMGSIGGYWKEYMEVFGNYAAISVSDFVDMRVRGFAGEHDRLFTPFRGEHAEAVEKFGFDFYEEYASQFALREREFLETTYDMEIEAVRRPIPTPFDPADFEPQGKCRPNTIIPDKGWTEALEHFAQCCLDGTEPDTADGQAGALSTNLAVALLQSLDTGQVVQFETVAPTEHVSSGAK